MLPHSRSFDDPDQMAEERRLMYVGLTRAKDRLYLTRAFRRTRYGDSEPSTPSRFLDDIPLELTDEARGQARRKTVSRVTSWSPPRPTLPTAPRFRAGQRVRHATFGEGLVIQSRVDGGDEIVTVHFEGVGLKRLMAGIADLERLED